jgi:hypothetical protein
MSAYFKCKPAAGKIFQGSVGARPLLEFGPPLAPLADVKRGRCLVAATRTFREVNFDLDFAAREQPKRRGALGNLILCRYHPRVPNQARGTTTPARHTPVLREDFNEKT